MSESKLPAFIGGESSRSDFARNSREKIHQPPINADTFESVESELSSYFVDSTLATAQYAGSAPGEVAGLLQVNAVAPQAAGPEPVPLTVSVGGIALQAGVTMVKWADCHQRP